MKWNYTSHIILSGYKIRKKVSFPKEREGERKKGYYRSRTEMKTQYVHISRDHSVYLTHTGLRCDTFIRINSIWKFSNKKSGKNMCVCVFSFCNCPLITSFRWCWKCDLRLFAIQQVIERMNMFLHQTCLIGYVWLTLICSLMYLCCIVYS